MAQREIRDRIVIAASAEPAIPRGEAGLEMAGLAELSRIVAVGAIGLPAPRVRGMTSQERRGMIGLARIGSRGIGTMTFEALGPHVAAHAGSRTRRCLRAMILAEALGMRRWLLA